MSALQPAEFDVVSVVLTYYDNLPDLHGDSSQEPGAAELEAQTVAALLAEFGGVPVPWPVPPRERNAGAVTRRLQQWASPTQPRNTVLHWVGHGWSNDLRASMALPESDAAVDGSGLTPEVLASFIRRRERSPHAGDSWAVILIDGCRSARFAEIVHSCLLRDDPHATERVLLLGASREGETRLGVLSHALELALESFRGSNQVRTWDLAEQLGHRLPNPYVFAPSTRGLLIRRTPVVTGANAPLDIYEDLTSFIRSLTADERLHLIPQASGAEHGDAAWYFVGRQAEKRRIAAWLKKEASGMLVVTGEGGQGKSALLGNIAALSQPRLRQLLVRGRYIAEPAPDETPPDYAFQGIVHATGMDRRGILESIARAVGYPAETLAALGTDSLADSLAASLTDRSRPFTFLVDALDEAAHPRAVADVLRWLSALPRCAVVVGTRPVQRQHSRGAVSSNLLEALAPDGLPDERLIVLNPDPEAVHQYVRLRLQKARRLELPEPAIQQAADAIAAQEPAFLAARLTVHELISRTEGHSASVLPHVLTEMAATGLQDDALFTAAMRRVMGTSQAARPLLLALALSEGRGMPRSGDVWASAASGMSGGPGVTEQDIDTLLRIAAPYVLIDEEDEQAVYRLSHEVFRSLMITQCLGGETDAAVSAHHTEMARHLAAAARQKMTDPDRRPADRLPPPYVRKYLAAHAAHGEVLEEILLRDPDLILALDHTSLAEHATSLDPESAQALALALEARGTAAPYDEEPPHRPALAAMQLWARRTGARRLAEACAAALPESGWALERALWSGIRSRELRGHTASVRAVGTGTVGGRHVIVSAAEDNTVRVWSGDDVAVFSAQRPTSVAVTRTEGEETVTALCDGTLRSWSRTGDERATAALPPERVTAFTVAPDDADLLYATAAALEIRRTHSPGRVGWHHDTVLALCSVGGPGSGMVLSGSADHSARLWDLNEGSLRALLTGHTASVLAVALGTASGRTLAATAGADRKVIVWDTETGGARHAHTLSSGPPRSVVFGRVGDREVLIAGCEDNRVRIWDAIDGTDRAILCGHSRPVGAVAVLAMSSGIQCVSGSTDGTIRLWDLYSVRPEQRSGLSGSVRALCWTANPAGGPLLLAADSEGELWTCVPGTAAAPLLAGRHHCGVRAAWSYGPPGSPNILIHGVDDELWLWDISSDRRSPMPQTGQARLAAATVGGPDDTTLVTADTEGWVRLHDLLAGGDDGRMHMPVPCRLIAYRAGRILTHHDDDSLASWRPEATEPEWTVALPGRRPQCMTVGAWGNRSVVALGHDDGEVRLYDVKDGALVDRRLLHDSPVTVLATVTGYEEPAVAAGAEDGRVALWYPSGQWTILTGHAEPVYSLAGGPDRHLATGGACGAIALWHHTV
ncbi:AAA family ATPase [Streptomyces sp. NPDC050698]